MKYVAMEATDEVMANPTARAGFFKILANTISREAALGKITVEQPTPHRYVIYREEIDGNG